MNLNSKSAAKWCRYIFVDLGSNPLVFLQKPISYFQYDFLVHTRKVEQFYLVT